MRNLDLKLLAILIFIVGIGYGQQLHTHSNAASIANEADSADGWGGNTVNSSVSSESYFGNYSIKIEATADGWRRAVYVVSTVPGQEYQISIYAKSSSNTSPGIYWEGWTSDSNAMDIGTNWSEYTTTKVAGGTSAIIYVYVGTPAVTGNVVYIDNVSVVPVGNQDTQSPSTPGNLSSSGQTDTTVNLSWNAATDNIGVTEYKVYKDGVLEATLGNVGTYQVTGLTASTTYSFTVTALDAAGNESTASNTVSVTTDSGSGGGGSLVWTEAGSVASYSGNVAIGTNTVPSGYKLAVDGHIRTREIRVDQDNWPDYVFTEGYDLPTLEEIKKHIEEKGHLPNIPSADEVQASGVELGEMDRLLLKKIEELTLYILHSNELHKAQRNINDQLKKELETLKKNDK